MIPHFLAATPKSGRGYNRAMNLLVSFFCILSFFDFLEFMVNDEGRSDSYKCMCI